MILALPCSFLKEEFAGYRPAEVIAKAVLGPRGDGTTKKPMTVFVPPRWHERPVLRPKKAGGAGSQRWCSPVTKLSTMQVIYFALPDAKSAFGLGFAVAGRWVSWNVGKKRQSPSWEAAPCALADKRTGATEPTRWAGPSNQFARALFEAFWCIT